MFYLQTMKKPSGATVARDDPGRWGTLPNTQERDFIYTRTVWVHLICVHIAANALAIALVISNHYDSG